MELHCETMKEKLERISSEDDLKEEFILQLNEQIASDEEPARKKFAALKEAYEQDAAVTDLVLMAICGWRMETLVDNAIHVKDN